MSAADRARVTFRRDCWRMLAVGVLESAGHTFLLLIAVLHFQAGAVPKALIAAGGSVGLLCSPVAVSLVTRWRWPATLGASRLLWIGAAACVVAAAVNHLWVFVPACMLAMTVAYASERRQFGVPIGSFQAVKHQLADASLAVAFAAPLVLRAANSLAHGDPDAGLHVSMAKAKASSAARTAADASLQCHGAIGYTVEYDLHLFMKRAWALSAQAGGPDQHRARVRAALGLR